jgi:hypothetical protein
MLVARQGRRNRARHARLTRATQLRQSLRAHVFSALCLAKDAHTSIARLVCDVVGVRVRPTRFFAADRQLAPCRQSLEPPSARALFLLNAAPCTLLGPPSAPCCVPSSSLRAACKLCSAAPGVTEFKPIPRLGRQQALGPSWRA